MDSRQPHGCQLKRTADLGQKGKQRWMIYPSLNLGLIVKQLVGPSLRTGAWHTMRQRGPIALDDCDIRLSPEKCWDREIIHLTLLRLTTSRQPGLLPLASISACAMRVGAFGLLPGAFFSLSQPVLSGETPDPGQTQACRSSAVYRSSIPSKLPEQIFPDAAPGPADKAVIDRGWRGHTRAGSRASDNRARCG